MLATLKTTDARSRIEPEIKERATDVLASCGLNLSDAIRLFLRQVVAQEGLPFEIKAPNTTSRTAMNEARTLKKPRFDSATALFNDLEKTTKQKRAKQPRNSNIKDNFPIFEPDA